MDIEDFDIENVKAGENLSKILSVRITENDFEWIKKKNISPTKLFNYILKKAMEFDAPGSKKRIKRERCVVCGDPTKKIEIGLGMESFSFCSQKCMEIYGKIEKNKKKLEVSGTVVYVK